MDAKQVLEQVRSGAISVEDAEQFFRRAPFEELGYAKLDTQRRQRTGFAEVVFCSGKADEYLVSIFTRLAAEEGEVLGTRATPHQFELVKAVCPSAVYDSIARIIKVEKPGKVLRGCRLDELPQLFNVFCGDMSFVGTRPEVAKFVDRYTPEMYATLLMPAGVTSEASIRFKDEAQMFDGSGDPEADYVNILLPKKMVYNLASVMNFSPAAELRTMVRTVLAVAGKDYSPDAAADDSRKQDGK